MKPLFQLKNGGAYRYFTTDPSKTEYKTDKVLLADYTNLKKRIKSMHEIYGVEFLICEAGMKKHGLKAKDIMSYVKISRDKMKGMPISLLMTNNLNIGKK